MLSALTALLISHEGPFRAESLEGALADTGGLPVLVFVHAAWCGPCNVLAAEVLTQPEGQAVAEGNVAVAIDADSPAGQRAVARYTVLSYPTLLLLDADGVETARVEGYEGKAAWLAQVAEAKARRLTVRDLEAALEREGEDPARRVQLAEGLLVRGATERALPILTAALASGGPHGVDAGRVLGRYHTRVRRDGEAGARIFARLVTLTQGTEGAGEFRYWHAQSLAMAGQVAQAVSALDAWVAAEPKSTEAAVARATVYVRVAAPPSETPGAAARAAIEAALALDPKLGAAHYLMAELCHRLGERAEAEAAIRRALAIDPAKPTWRNFAVRSLGLELQ